MLRSISAFYFVIACTVQAQSVVVDHNIELRTSPIHNSLEFNISKFSDVRPGSICGCDAGISMTYSGGTLAPGDVTADEGSDWYLTQPGDVFSAVTIDARLFPLLTDAVLRQSATTPLFVGPDDFYLGVRTGFGFTNDRPNRTAYGWVHLRPVNGVLTMVENVMSYNSQGIVVGTTRVVPEPGFPILAASLALITSVSPLMRRRIARTGVSRA